MKDIKIKDKSGKSIKKLNKALLWTQRIKDPAMFLKEKSKDAVNNNGNIEDYGNNKIESITNRAKNESIHQINKVSKNVIHKTGNQIKKKIVNYSPKPKKKHIKKKTIKKIERTIEKTEKIAKEAAKKAKIAAQRARELAIKTAKETVKLTKTIIKATISMVKAIIAGVKSLIAFIASFGTVAVVIIVVICLVGLLCASIFGIFFSGEKTGNNITMTEVVKDLNKEMATKISNIQKNNQHDDYVINTNRAEWKDVLTIYAAKISNGTMEQEVMTLDDNKINTLKTIFWDMHEISYEVKTEIIEDDELERSDYTSEQKVLYITITSKTVEQMMNEYSFSIQQREQVQELLKDDYASLWAAPIYGISLGSPNMVTIALSQVGNVGGEPYWSWYGFNSRVAWCACFVSWVAYQSGYIQNAIIPKFAGVRNGVDWFKAMDEWHDKNYVPHSGDIIFFDWENDGKANHVGIVEKVENNKVYTIEGNSNDECKQKEYSLNSNVIYGYGVPLY